MKNNFIAKHWKRIIMFVLFVILVAASLLIGSYTDGELTVPHGAGIAQVLVRPLRVAAMVPRAFINALHSGDETAWLIFWQSRVPRTLAVVISAAGLSVGGLIMQAISRNKFMSPGTSGATDAAALGLLLAFIFLPPQSGIVQTLFAFVFAFLATMLFVVIINRLKIREVVYIPLLGMMYGGMIAAVSTAIAFHFEAIQMLNAYNLASFSRFGHFEMVYLVLVPLGLAVAFATKFSIIGLGADFAKNLGINYNRVVFLGLMAIALISASTFVSVGPLPFVGLIIPSMATTFYGDNLKKSIVDLMMFGANFVLLSDIVSRLMVHPGEVNVSVIISVAGGAVFMVYLIRGMSGGRRAKRSKRQPAVAAKA